MKLTILFQHFSKLIASKKSYVLFSVFLSSLNMPTINLLEKLTNATEEGIIPLLIFTAFNVFAGLFIFIDLVLGIVAARREGQVIQSDKWGVTIGKFFGLILYSTLVAIIILIFPNSYIILTFVFTPVILTILKEFISIGENLERINGKKSYMFSVIDKLFDIIEMRFFKSLTETEIAPTLPSSDDEIFLENEQN